MLETGTVIDRKYKILDVIGRGGMSVVYLAINEKANKPWAVKEIRKTDYRIFDLDKKEIELMKRLSHPNLPSIIDVIERKDSLLIVMDYIEGRSLEAILEEQGAMPEQMVIGWAIQLCKVLAYLHSRSPAIIYRDMKPANVMLKPDGTVMLIDFGAAREFRTEHLKDTICLGTRGYAAPEQYEETGHSDVRTDIYCLGVMLFELLTGESPHRLQPIRQKNPALSPGLEVIVKKCTQLKKEDRYQSCLEVLYALEHYWELDIRYRKYQRRKLIQFCIPAALTVLLGMGAILFGGLEHHTRNSNYESCLLAAGNSVSKEEELENYRRAIRLEPARGEAYLALLREGLLDDQILTAEESELLRQVLIDYGDDKESHERAFRRNREDYEQFAYEAGVAYFYKFQEKSNKKNARGYLEIAAASETLSRQQRERARRLYLISDYYSRIGLLDEAGDELVTYEDYWKDLTALTAGNLVEVDNERTALVMYEELTGQIISRAEAFKNAGVEQKEMLQKLGQIRNHLETDFTGLDGENRRLLEEEFSHLEQMLEQAERMIRSAYEEEGQV